MLTLDSGGVSLSRSALGDSVQTIWLVGRHSDPFTLDNTVLCCVTVAPLGMFLLAYLFDTYPLIFESHAALSQFLGICFVIGLRYYWVCHLGKICNIFFYCLHRCEKCYAGTGLHSISCFNRIPAKKWGDTEIAERGRLVLVMRARYRSAGLIPHQRGWTDAG